MTLEKLTLKAQDAIARAQQIASEYAHQQIEPVHILQALLQEREGLVPTILKKIGLDLHVIETSFDHEINRLPKLQGSAISQIYLSNTSQKMLNQAMKYAHDLKDDYISTEHILLAIIQHADDTAARILYEMVHCPFLGNNNACIQDSSRNHPAWPGPIYHFHQLPI